MRLRILAVAIYFDFGVVRMAKLTPKQKRFVNEYLVDLNARPDTGKKRVPDSR